MRPPINKGKRIVKINAFTQANLIKLLMEGAYSCEQLSEETGLHYVTVLHYTRELHRVKAAHITAWEKDDRGRDAIRIYKLGAGKDAQREKLTTAERTRRYRQKRKAMELLNVMSGTARYVQRANGRLKFEAH